MLAGTLFTIDFQIEDIRSTEAWADLADEDVSQFASRCRSLLSGLAARRDPIEAETESHLIWPVVEALGWADWLPQQKLSAKGRKDIPDGLLFGSPPENESAAGPPSMQRLDDALYVIEATCLGPPPRPGRRSARRRRRPRYADAALPPMHRRNNRRLAVQGHPEVRPGVAALFQRRLVGRRGLARDRPRQASARAAAAEILTLERRLSDLVNAAYGLTPEEVALMWRTAPPRMPLDPAEELRRLGPS